VHTLSELQNSITTATEYYNGLNLSSPSCLILDGDLNMYCDPLIQPRLALEVIAEQFDVAGIPTVTLHDSEFLDCGDYQERLDAGVAAIESGISELVGIGRTTNRSILPAYVFQKIDDPVFSMDYLPTQQRFLAEFPGCGLGNADRANPDFYPSIMKMFLSSDPAENCTAVAWLAHMRGGFQSEHLPFAFRYFDKRFSGEYRFVQEAYLDAIREVGEERPELLEYLQGAGSFGWPMRLGAAPVSVPDEGISGEAAITLQVYPNPINPKSTFRFTLANPGEVELVLYDVSGRKVRTILDGVHLDSGAHEIQWNAEDDRRISSGVYFLRLASGSQERAATIVILK